MWTVVTKMQIRASLNHRKNMKAEPSRMISRKLTEKTELLKTDNYDILKTQVSFFFQVTSENGSSIRYCGTTAPHNATWIDMRSSVMSVQFHSDLSIEKTGYKLYYRIKRKYLRFRFR